MNLDSGPSFNLVFSQLDNVKQYEEVINFVPDIFEKDSDDFNENRSKYTNDPATMKKLHENHAKKAKKKETHDSKKRRSTSLGGRVPIKRRRVIEVTSRDVLSKIFACS